MATSLPASKYASNKTEKIPARSGVAVPLHKDQVITVINKHGTQVVDFWFVKPDLTAYLSMCHTRASLLRLSPKVGDTLVDSHRQPMIQLIEDTTPLGIHDTLIAACDLYRYHELGVPESEYHENCTDNYRNALARDAGIKIPSHACCPDPFNLFMNIPVVPRAQPSELDGNEVKNVSVGADIAFEAPICRPGDHVKLKALVDGIVVMSACPQDILKINNQAPTDAFFVVD